GSVASIGASRQTREFLIYWLALAFVIAILGAIFLLLRSRYGLALTAIRDNELAARSSGIDIARVKLAIYVITAGAAAPVGALIFLQKLRISPSPPRNRNNWPALL